MSANDLSQEALPRGMMTTSEVAKRLGVSLRTVQLWVEAGILPAARTPGGHRRIPATAVEALALSTGLAERVSSLAPASAPAPAVAPPAASGPFDVLLVEDNTDLRRLWEITLEALGNEISLRVADTGYTALLQIGQRKPDLLVTDLMLPGMDGFEMIRTLERSDAFAGLQILAITSLSREHVVERGGLPQAVALLHKPVSPDVLVARVREYLEGSGRSR